MLQIATFALPDEQEKANQFLATHKPLMPVNIERGQLTILFEDGKYAKEYVIAEYREMLEGNRQARQQHEIALHVLEYQLADLNAKHNKGRYEEVENSIIQMKREMYIQEAKAAFVERKIKELEDEKAGE